MSRMAESKDSISFWPLSWVLMQIVLPLRQWSLSPLNPARTEQVGASEAAGADVNKNNKSELGKGNDGGISDCNIQLDKSSWSLK